MYWLSPIGRAVVALVISGSAIYGQESIQLEPGARVRLTLTMPRIRVVRIVRGRRHRLIRPDEIRSRKALQLGIPR